MGREIKFRGLVHGRKKCKWEYGSLWIDDLIPNTGVAIVVGMGHYPVVKESVGQFTGLTDKNGVEIYEGDVVKHELSKAGAPVFFNNGYVGGWVLGWDDNFCSLGSRLPAELEVIGNIHEDKDILTKCK